MPQQTKSKGSTKADVSKKRNRNLIFVTAGVLVVAGGITAAVLLSKPKAPNPLEKFQSKDDPTPVLPAKPKPDPRPSGSSGSSGIPDTSFPLIKGMIGKRIELLQKGLNRQFGLKLATDGDWGKKTQQALVANSVRTPITKRAWLGMLRFLKLSDPYGVSQAQSGGSTGSISAARIAQSISNATNQKNANGVLAALRKLHSVQDYRNVSDLLTHVNRFETRDKLGNRVNRNLVNTLMANRMPWQFHERSQFAAELRRIGLKQNGDRWSLGSLGQSRMAVTLQNTVITTEANVLQDVPAGTLIGSVLYRGQHFVQVLSPKGIKVSVPANAVLIS